MKSTDDEEEARGFAQARAPGCNLAGVSTLRSLPVPISLMRAGSPHSN